jgi:hypothetical protein
MADPLLASVDELGILVGETISDEDPKALLLLRTASAIVRSPRGCGQFITRVVDDVIKRTPIGGHTVFLPQLPIESVSLVQRPSGDGWATVTVSSYEVDEETGRIQLRHHSWPYSTRWQITYTHGYAEIPDAITGAVLGLAARAWETPIGVDNERIGQRSIKYLMLENGFLPEEEAALAQFKYPGAH